MKRSDTYYLVRVLLVAILTLVNVESYAARPPTFTIPDANFASFLKSEYPSLMYGNDLDMAGAGNVTGILDCGGRNISDLSGIEYFTSISILVCRQNNLTTLDISTLDLIAINVRINDLSSITGLANQTNMQFLWLDLNELTDVSDIKGLDKLYHLSIDNNQLSSFPDLSNFPILEEASVGSNPLPPGILDVSSNSLLKKLACSYLNLVEITGLKNATQLIYFDCRDNQITDLSDLKYCTRLASIWARNNLLTSFPDLSYFPDLMYLQLSGNQLGTIDVAANPELLYFEINEANLSTVDGLDYTTKLKWFYADENELVEIWDLEFITSLVEIQINDNLITELPDFTSQTNMTSVMIEENILDFSDAREIRIIDSLPSLVEFNYEIQQQLASIGSINTCIGDTMVVSIDAQDSATHYQWHLDGAPIAGANDAFYSLPNFSTGDVGTYWCRAYGTALQSPYPMSLGAGVSYFQSQDITAIVDPSCAGSTGCTGNKVEICHVPPGNPGNAHTICVGAGAVAAHLAHGDYLGPCVGGGSGSNPPVSDPDASGSGIGSASGEESSVSSSNETPPDETSTSTGGYTLAVAPNPFVDQTTISYSLSEDAFVTIQIIDIYGNVQAVIVNSLVGAGDYSSVFEINLSGVYTVLMTVDGIDQMTQRILGVN